MRIPLSSVLGVPLLAIGLTACGKPSPAPAPAPSPGPNPITGRERLGWDQQAPSAAELAAYSFVLYVDNNPAVLTSTCDPPAGTPPVASCSAALPSLTPGQHTLELAARVERDGSLLESARSTALVVTVTSSIVVINPGNARDRSDGSGDGTGFRLLRDGGRSDPRVRGRTDGATPAAGQVAALLTTPDGGSFELETVATGLDRPVALAMAPDGRLFVIEATGVVRVVRDGVVEDEPAAVFADGDPGIGWGAYAMTVDPDFARTRAVYVGYVARDPAGTTHGRIVRFREIGDRFGEPVVIFDDLPAGTWAPRVRVGPDGRIYVAVADSVPSESDDLGSHAGKILRLSLSGGTPADNPFRSSPVFSLGRGDRIDIDWDPAGTLWQVELGETRVRIGRTRAGLHPEPAVDLAASAVGSARFHTGAGLAAFRGDLFLASPDDECLYRVRGLLSPGGDVTVERLLAGHLGRITTVQSGPDGLYLATGNGRAEDVLLRIRER